MAKKKKVELPDEIQSLVNEVKDVIKIIPDDEVIEEPVNTFVDWDFSLNDKVNFFDINLSYELTGYRPITKDKGLDFDPDWFTEARETFLRTGLYTSFRRGSKAFADFWRTQYKRCKHGMTVNGYTITGDNYFFLNFFLLMDLDNTSKAGGGRAYIFPAFYAGLYEMFHYIELCRKLRLNACIMKSREVIFCFLSLKYEL